MDRDAEPSMADEVRDAAEALARERAQEAVRDAIDRELKKHPETQERIDAFAAWAGERRETLQDTWAGITPEGRNRLRAAMAAGFVLGLLLGFFLADLSTILASAGAGSALALIGIRLLTEPLGLEAVGRLLDNPAVTAACWTVLAMAGTGLQWTRRGQRADNGRRGA